VTLVNSTVSGNIASLGFGGSGGGINNFRGTTTLTNSTVSGNKAYNGGGIFNFSGTVTLTGSTVSGNQAGRGGGIYNHRGAATVVMTNSTISGNVAPLGGGIYNEQDGTLMLTNSTVSDNKAGQGGGISASGTLILTNTIVARNTAPTGPDCHGSPFSLGHNLIGDVSDCSFTPVTGDLINVHPKLGPLQDSGGPTKTHALLPGSPAIDAADNIAAPERDQRGVPRPVDGDGDGTATSDIGSHEFDPSINTPPVAFDQASSTTVDTPVTISLRGFEADAVDTLSFIIVSLPSSGGLSEGVPNITTTPHILTGDTVTFTPHTGSTGTVSFTYKVNDGKVDSNIATIMVTIPVTLAVTKTGDTNDGICDADCSLREAIAAANSQAIGAGSSGDTIVIPTGTYTLTLGSELGIADNLTLTGVGSGNTIIEVDPNSWTGNTVH